MKKALFSILTIVLATTFLPVSAYAATTRETEISQYAEQYEKVTKAKCLVYEKICIVAVKTEKFLSKSEFDQFKDKLSNDLMQKFDLEHVAVTRSPKAMHVIERISNMSDSEREKAIKEFFENLSARPEKPIQSRYSRMY